MQLPNFIEYEPFNKLRKELNNAPLVEWNPAIWLMTDFESLVDKLNSYEGIEIDISEIKKCPDGTFEFKGRKVLLYIRDQWYFPRGGDKSYKFHISDCEVITKYQREKKIDRYVISTRRDGRFKVNVRNYYTRLFIKQNVIEELKVCKKCLMHLHYKGYNSYSDNDIYENFSIDDFFKKYNSSFSSTPKHTDETAPQDEYSEDFDKISRNMKERKSWTCEECRKNFSNDKKFLHVHHKNGIKSDNSPNNLKVLCIGCHANQLQHSQLKNSSHYKEYLKKYPPK